jgi:hypothetical protein
MTEATPLPCSQCGKLAVFNSGLCVDCGYKAAVAQTLLFRNAAILTNHAAAEMDSVVGIGFTPRMQIPDLPKAPIIMHNIHVADSVVGSINTGSVQTVDVNITYLKQGGNKDLADALQKLTESIANETNLNADNKNNLLDQVAYLSDQASCAAKDRKRGMIKAAMDSLNVFAQGANSITSITVAWQHVEPLLKVLFGA